MNRLIIPVMLVLSIISVKAQQRAVTETGDAVILYEDGTWQYEDEKMIEKEEIPENPKSFEKAESATFQLKSKNINVGFYLDPKKWSFTKDVDNKDAEYELTLKGEDLYGMIITEKIEIPVETLKSIAYENAKTIAPDIKIEEEEYRNVNGIKVLFMKMNGTMQGIKFSYYGYYYSNTSGSLQFVTYTSQNLMDQYLEASEDLLNGIVELDENE